MTRLTADDFNRLYREHARRVQGFFLRMTGGDGALAEDLTQELFTRLWERRNHYDPAHPFTTWMYAAAYNLCKNEYRHRAVVETWSRNANPDNSSSLQDDGSSLQDNEGDTLSSRSSVHDVPTTPAADDALTREEQRAFLAHAVQQLPDTLRDVFRLRYEEELPIAEVALILQIPEGTVKSRAFAALKSLRSFVKNQF